MEFDVIQALLSKARGVVLAAIEDGGVEGHLCAVVLRRGPPAWATDATASMLAMAGPPLTRTTGAGVAGLRVALGVLPADMPLLTAALARELSRQAMPSAGRVHDDERFILGIAAGVAACPPLTGLLVDALASGASRSLRWGVVAHWGRWLASGKLDAGSAAKLVCARLDLAPTFGDAVPLLWLAGELLDAEWAPGDDVLGALDAAIRRLRAAVMSDLPPTMEPLDAAWLLRALTALPTSRLARRSSVEAIVAVVEGFPAAAQVLSRRPRGRSSVDMEDEYDVQWLLHALLLPVVPDIVPEDPAPKLAGASSRLDFTSRAVKLGIEVKHLRKKGDASRMREELMVDQRQYQLHPYVETVVCFVYDPNGHIALAERAVFENDLSKAVTIDGRTVNYIVRVR